MVTIFIIRIVFLTPYNDHMTQLSVILCSWIISHKTLITSSSSFIIMLHLVHESVTLKKLGGPEAADETKTQTCYKQA